MGRPWLGLTAVRKDKSEWPSDPRVKPGFVHVVARVDSVDHDADRSADGSGTRGKVWRLSPIIPLFPCVPAAKGLGLSLVDPASSPELLSTLTLINAHLRRTHIQAAANSEDFYPASVCEELEAWGASYFDARSKEVREADAKAATLPVQPTPGDPWTPAAPPRKTRARRASAAAALQEWPASDDDVVEVVVDPAVAALEARLATKTQKLKEATARIKKLEADCAEGKRKTTKLEAKLTDLLGVVEQLKQSSNLRPQAPAKPELDPPTMAEQSPSADVFAPGFVHALHPAQPFTRHVDELRRDHREYDGYDEPRARMRTPRTDHALFAAQRMQHPDPEFLLEQRKRQRRDLLIQDLQDEVLLSSYAKRY